MNELHVVHTGTVLQFQLVTDSMTWMEKIAIV